MWAVVMMCFFWVLFWTINFFFRENRSQGRDLMELWCGSGDDGMVKVKSNEKIVQLLKKKVFLKMKSLKMVSLIAAIFLPFFLFFFVKISSWFFRFFFFLFFKLQFCNIDTVETYGNWPWVNGVKICLVRGA